MKYRIISLLMALSVLVGGVSRAADFEKGEAAYDSGDFETALREWTPLAQQGDANAQYRLGALYYRGEGVAVNQNLALEWFAKSADNGHAETQALLGALYYLGEGVEKNYDLALKYLRQSSEQGNAESLHILGVMYLTGEGVTADMDKAVKLIAQAAEQDYDVAQAFLGGLYYSGDGVKQDYVRAHMWINLASSLGKVKDAEFIAAKDNLEGAMTSSQIEKAENLARECIRKDYKNC